MEGGGHGRAGRVLVGEVDIGCNRLYRHIVGAAEVQRRGVGDGLGAGVADVNSLVGAELDLFVTQHTAQFFEEAEAEAREKAAAAAKAKAEAEAKAALAEIATHPVAVGALGEALAFGSLVLGMVGDRIGRRALLTLSIALMGGATLLLGLLPTYDDIGVTAPLGDLVVTMSASPPSVSVGGTVTYQIAVTNVGLVAAARPNPGHLALAESNLALALYCMDPARRRYDEAEALLRYVLEIHPGNPVATMHLERLESLRR